MKYAIVISGGKQYKVSAGDTIMVDKLSAMPESGHTFTDVLLFVDGDMKEIGMPLVPNAQVSGKILEHVKDKKIRVAKFKAKAKYRRATGFRASMTKIQIDSLELKKAATAK